MSGGGKALTSPSTLGTVGSIGALAAAPMTGGASLFALPAIGAATGGMSGGGKGALIGGATGAAGAALGGLTIPGADPLSSGGILSGLGSQTSGTGLTMANSFGGNTSGLSQAAQASLSPNITPSINPALLTPQVNPNALVGTGLTSSNTSFNPSMIGISQNPTMLQTVGKSANIMNNVNALNNTLNPIPQQMQPMPQLQDQPMSLSQLSTIAPNAFSQGY